MARLSEDIIPIPLPALKILQQQNVLTVLDFLQEDPEKITALTSLPFKDIVDLRQQLISNYSGNLKSGMDLYQELVSNSLLVTTGIKSLDILLRGGLLTGNTYEVCGSSGDGKTQLCLTVAANISHYHKQEVHFVDTKNDFSANRLSAILLSQGLTSEDCESAMNRIKVTKLNDLYQLITFVKHLKQLLRNSGENICRLVIIDAMPPLYFPFLGESNNEGLGLLNYLMSTIKNLTMECHIVFMTVNLATSYVEAEDTNEEQNRLEPVTDVRPMLGKYWLHAIGTRLLIKQINTTSDERCIKIIKSTYLQIGKSCNVRLGPSGFQ